MVAGALINAPANAAAKETLTVWATGGDADAAVMAEAGKLFMAKNPNVTVKVEAISWGDGFAKVLAAAAAQKGPDIFTGGLSWGISAGNKGALADLRALSVVSKVQPLVAPQIFKALVGYQSSKVYAVPFDLTLMMMFYDKSTLSKAGITSAPKTVDDFNAAAAKLKAAGVKVPVYNEWGNGDWLGFFSWLYSMGGSLYDSKCRVTINNAKGVAALTQYKKLYSDYGALKPGVADWSMNDNIKKGNYGIGFSGNFQASSYYTYYKDYTGWTAAPVPAAAGSKSVAFIGGRGISIMNYIPRPKQILAGKFITSLYEEATVKAMNVVGAAQNSIFLSPVVKYADTIAAYPSDVLATIKSQLADAQGPPNCNGWEDAQNDVTNNLQKFLFGTSTAQQALDGAAAAMKAKANA